ncbi:hypothetical protein M0804_007955 [Polistes exclamans]|nr:hypothetical protein M0804_007955 [Polistes exclamans]
MAGIVQSSELPSSVSRVCIPPPFPPTPPTPLPLPLPLHLAYPCTTFDRVAERVKRRVAVCGTAPCRDVENKNDENDDNFDDNDNDNDNFDDNYQDDVEDDDKEPAAVPTAAVTAAEQAGHKAGQRDMSQCVLTSRTSLVGFAGGLAGVG